MRFLISLFPLSDVIINADIWVNNLLSAFRNRIAVEIFLWITLLGESEMVAVFAFSISVFLWLKRKRWEIIPLWITILGSGAFVFIAKMIFHRSRPSAAVYLENSASFPSGHALIAVAFYGFLAYLLLQNKTDRKSRVLIIASSIAVMLAIGFSRLYLGVHYFSDVLAGYGAGFLWLLFGMIISERKLDRNK